MLIAVQVLIPLVAHSTKLPHPQDVIDAWEADLVARFGGFTLTGVVRGAWLDDAGTIVGDESRCYVIAVDPARVDELREFARAACAVFDQRCIYFQIVGQAELLYP